MLGHRPVPDPPQNLRRFVLRSHTSARLARGVQNRAVRPSAALQLVDDLLRHGDGDVLEIDGLRGHCLGPVDLADELGGVLVDLNNTLRRLRHAIGEVLGAQGERVGEGGRAEDAPRGHWREEAGLADEVDAGHGQALHQPGLANRGAVAAAFRGAPHHAGVAVGVAVEAEAAMDGDVQGLEHAALPEDDIGLGEYVRFEGLAEAEVDLGEAAPDRGQERVGGEVRAPLAQGELACQGARQEAFDRRLQCEGGLPAEDVHAEAHDPGGEVRVRVGGPQDMAEPPPQVRRLQVRALQVGDGVRHLRDVDADHHEGEAHHAHGVGPLDVRVGRDGRVHLATDEVPEGPVGAVGVHREDPRLMLRVHVAQPRAPRAFALEVTPEQVPTASDEVGDGEHGSERPA
mmetsp:Transcript_121174/g.348121  ORF Transcript_121174/g.348121 Transcript_121174/m.348121 type:complete len:401 (-) Transcript_121174:636-1838(-)